MNLADVKGALAHANRPESHDAAVLIPLIEQSGSIEVLLEVRAHTLTVQPGEVCLPGGAIEPGESPLEAAVRETCEELLVRPEQLEVLADLGPQPGPGGRPLHVFVAVLHGYKSTWSPDEVERTFTVTLDWLTKTIPQIYEVTLSPSYPPNYPWDLVPGGKGYPWRPQINHVPFYLESDPLIWGATARILMRFADICRPKA